MSGPISVSPAGRMPSFGLAEARAAGAGWLFAAGDEHAAAPIPTPTARTTNVTCAIRMSPSRGELYTNGCEPDVVIRLRRRELPAGTARAARGGGESEAQTRGTDRSATTVTCMSRAR